MKATVAAIKVILSLLFIGCLWSQQYEYYQLVRFIGMAGFLILAYHERENRMLFVFWGMSALLINPFIKIALGRTIWNVIDVMWAACLILSFISSVEPARSYLRNRRIKNLLRDATLYIFSSSGDFEALTSRFVKGDNQSRLAAFCVLEVASLRVPSSEEERLLEVLTKYAENLQKVLDSDFEQIIEIQKTKAEIEFLKTKTAFLLAEQTCIEGDYSFECMRYKMERAKRGPLTQIEWGDIADKAKQIKELDKKIDDLTNKHEQTDKTQLPKKELKLTQYHIDANKRELEANKKMPKVTREEFIAQANRLKEARNKEDFKRKPDGPTNADQPTKKKSILDDPKQQRFFEKMGTVYKVTKPNTDDNTNNE